MAVVSLFLGVLGVALALLAVAAAYVFLKPDPKYAPPRFRYKFAELFGGKYSFKETGPVEFLKAGYKQCGEIFRFGLAHQNVTVFIGKDAQALFFESSDDEAAQAPVYRFTVPVFGKGIVYDAPRKVMQDQLKFVSKGLMANALRAHCEKIVMEATNYFNSWPQEGECDLLEKLSELTILTASRCLLGREVREGVQLEFANWYQKLSDGMSHLSYFWPNAPTKAHRERDEARREIAKIFGKVIAQRRATNNETKEDDFLQVLIESQYKETGGNPTDDEITGLLLAALFAGQHTSNITSTWMGFEILSKKKELLPKILAEQKEVLSKTDGVITREALDAMEFLHHCMQETLRMHPPLIILMRKAMTDLKFKDYIVPKGDVLAVAPCVSMMLPEIFPNPTDFDPERFEGFMEDKGSGKWEFIAFGGGKHTCLGRRFAFLQIKTIWSILFRSFEIELVSPMPKPDYSAIVVGPRHPCTIKFKRIADPTKQ